MHYIWSNFNPPPIHPPSTHQRLQHQHVALHMLFTDPPHPHLPSHCGPENSGYLTHPPFLLRLETPGSHHCSPSWQKLESPPFRCRELSLTCSFYTYWLQTSEHPRHSSGGFTFCLFSGEESGAGECVVELLSSLLAPQAACEWQWPPILPPFFQLNHQIKQRNLSGVETQPVSLAFQSMPSKLHWQQGAGHQQFLY